MTPPGEPPAPARVLIVEDHAVVRGVLRLACDEEPGLEVVADVADGASALEACRTLRPDVMVLDLSLPGELQGLDVARRVRAEGRPIRILVLTGRTDDEAVFESIRAGVDGFLDKSAGVGEFAEALRRVVAGERVFRPEHERGAVAELGRFVRGFRGSAGPSSGFTQREREILEYLTVGLSVKQVAKRLGLSPRTVETHIAKVYRKLGVANRVQAISRAASLGLVEIDRPGASDRPGGRR